MRKWGTKSQRIYGELHPDLQLICTYILHEVADISLVYGHRGRTDQNLMFENGFSKLRFPDSKHNKKPSRAVDLQPYPLPEYEPKVWAALGYIAGRAKGFALSRGIQIRWGGDWDSDGDLTDQTFDDLFHIELLD